MNDDILHALLAVYFVGVARGIQSGGVAGGLSVANAEALAADSITRIKSRPSSLQHITAEVVEVAVQYLPGTD